YLDADELTRLGNRGAERGRQIALHGVVAAEDEVALGTQGAAGTAVIAHALHIVVLLRDRRDDVPGQAPVGGPAEQLVEPRLAAAPGHNLRDDQRRQLEQSVRLHRRVLEQPGDLCTS